MVAVEAAQVAMAECASRNQAPRDFATGLGVAARQNRASYENRTRFVPALPPAAIRGIVPLDRHAAGALILVELSLGCAQSVSARRRVSDLETGPITANPSFSSVCDSWGVWRSIRLWSRRRSFRFGTKLLAC